jgi:hypothetical protein
MEISSFVRQEVEITSVYFRSLSDHHNLESFPKKMIYRGQEYNFLNDGFRYQINTSREPVRIFDVSDGNVQYRLKLDNANHWTLLGIKAG